MGMGCARKGGCVQRQHKAHAPRREIDRAKTGDPCGDIAAQHVDRQTVAQLQPQLLGLGRRKAHLRLAGVSLGPPGAFGDRGALGQGVGIGDAPIATDDPVITGNLFGRAAVDLGDDPAQHGRRIDPADLGISVCQHSEGFDLIGLDIDKKVGRRAVRKVAVDGAAQVGVDLPDCRQHGKTQPKRQDH